MRFTLLLTICALIITASASAPSFCKCTCFTNSTIIPLSSHSMDNKQPPKAALATCATCNKAFCLAQRLPICKAAEEKDVMTTCFQRDSRKDQIVVITFIVSTLGLLGWAGVRRLLEKRKESGNVRMGTTQQGYARVGGR